MCGQPVKTRGKGYPRYEPDKPLREHECKETPVSIDADPFATGAPHIPIPTGVIKGPADADHYRVKVGRYGDRWYTDPLPGCQIAPAVEATWPSVSIVKKASGSDWTNVAIKRIAGALRDDPRCLNGLDFEACKDRLRSINRLDLSQAARRGTNVHTYFEMALRGHGVRHITGPDEDGGGYLPAVQAFFDAYQPELVAAEIVCINRDLNGVGYGGTADGIIRIDGLNYWVDYKSRGDDSAHGAYAEEAAQVGAGARAQYMVTEGPDGPRRQTIPDLAGGLVISVKTDGVRIYPVDLDKAFAHWTNLHAWWVARREEKAAIGKPWAPRSVTHDAADSLAALIDRADSVQALTALWQANQHRWTAGYTALASARKAELTALAVAS